MLLQVHTAPPDGRQELRIVEEGSTGHGRLEDARGCFERVVDEEKDQIYSYARYILGSAQEAEDVVQESLIKLWRHFDSLDGCVRGWLHRVVRNACYDRLRRRRTVRKVHSDDEEAAQRAPAPTSTPAEKTEALHVQEAVREAIGQIGEPYRSALVLRELLELSYREVSDRLDLPVNTIKTHVHRGRRMLRERMQRRGWSPSDQAAGSVENDR